MTIEEKAKRYDEAIERAKYYQKENGSAVISAIFPELKESEDERIRKELIDAVQGLWDNDALPMPLTTRRRDEWLAWLKKQGKKVDVIEGFDTEFEKQVSHLLASVLSGEDEYTEGLVKWASNSLLGYAKHEIEKQGEHKSAWSEEDENHVIGITQIIACAIKRNVVSQKTGEMEIAWLKSLSLQDKSALEATNGLADKIEPRFKVGDWVVANYSRKISQVVAVSEDGYGYQLNDGLCFGVSWCDIFHLWNIKNDANDGDVLQLGKVTVIFKELIGNEHCKCYCSICNGKLSIPSQDGADNDYGCCNAAPATKEQWDALRSKMKEAGYEWDSEKKELKEIVAPKSEVGDDEEDDKEGDDKTENWKLTLARQRLGNEARTWKTPKVRKYE